MADLDEYKMDDGLTVDLDAKDDLGLIVEAPKKEAEHDGGEEPERQEADGDESAEPESESERPRKPKKETHAERKARQRRRQQERDAENEALRYTVEQLKQTLSEVQANQRTVSQQTLEQQINAAASEFHAAKAAIAKAVAEGADPSDYIDRMLAARTQHEKLSGVKEKESKPAPRGVDPSIKVLADKWLSRNSWFRPPDQFGRTDEDSAAILALENSVRAAGYAPNTAAYYEELDRRAARIIPHRYEADDEDEAPKKGGARGGPQMTGSVRQMNGQNNSGNRYTFTRDQLAAIKAGGHDISNPKVLREFAQAYRQHEAEVAAKQRRRA